MCVKDFRMNFIAVEGQNAVLLAFWGLISNKFEVDTDISDEHAAVFSTVQETVSKLSLNWFMRGRIWLCRKAVG